MSNMQRDGKACVKFSKGIFCVLITLMKLLNTSSDFSAYVAEILMPLCLGALTFLQHQKTLPLEMGLRALMSVWPNDCTLALQKPFWHRYGETLCTFSCARRKGKGSGKTVPQALAHLRLVPFPQKWSCATERPDAMTLVTQEGSGIAQLVCSSRAAHHSGFGPRVLEGGARWFPFPLHLLPPTPLQLSLLCCDAELN